MARPIKHTAATTKQIHTALRRYFIHLHLYGLYSLARVITMVIANPSSGMTRHAYTANAVWIPCVRVTILLMVSNTHLSPLSSTVVHLSDAPPITNARTPS